MAKSIKTDCTLEDVKAVIHKWLYIEDDRIISLRYYKKWRVLK
jgi:hypothetical protein